MSDYRKNDRIQPWRPAALGMSMPSPQPARAWISDLGQAQAPARGKALWEMTAEQAFALGMKQGREEASRELRAGYDQSLANVRQRIEQEYQQRLSTLYEGFAGQVEQAEQQIARQIIELAVRLASVTVRHHIEHDPEAALPVVQEALSGLLPGHHPVRITLHPDDETVVRAALVGKLGLGEIEIVTDAAMARSGCRINTHSCEIDNDLDRRWQESLRQSGIDSEEPLHS